MNSVPGKTKKSNSSVPVGLSILTTTADTMFTDFMRYELLCTRNSSETCAFLSVTGNFCVCLSNNPIVDSHWVVCNELRLWPHFEAPRWDLHKGTE